MKVLFVYPKFSRHAEHNPELRECVPMNEYLGSPSLGIAAIAAATPAGIEIEHRDDRVDNADFDTDADVVALSFFTPAASRGIELAKKFKARGKKVVAGGIFPTMMPDEVRPHVDAVVVGEGEEVWPTVLDDLMANKSQGIYKTAPADCSKLPTPKLELYFTAEKKGVFEPDDYPVQTSRGCPMTCDACVLPTVMHDHIRPLPIENIVGQLDKLAAAGKRACLTEDTSWFPGHGKAAMTQLVDHLAATGRTASISYIGISMPQILATPASFFHKLRAIGVKMFYLVGGFDPVTRGAFTKDNARQRERAEQAIAKCWDVDIEPYTSFLIGNEADDLGTPDRMLEFTNKTQIRKAEFAIFTPYPGTPSWHRMNQEGRILHRDWSRYNDANVVFRHKEFTPEQLHKAYIDLWRGFYSTRMGLADLPQAERTIQF